MTLLHWPHPLPLPNPALETQRQSSVERLQLIATPFLKKKKKWKEEEARNQKKNMNGEDFLFLACLLRFYSSWHVVG